MLDLARVPDDFIEPATRVVDAVLEASRLTSGDVMLVGAWCRDILHHALGHTFETTATRDLDLALTLASWDAYSALAAAYPEVGHTGLRYRIAGFEVDLLPFGDIEDPEGVVEPPSRDVPLSVWAFGEIFAASLPLALRPDLVVRIPTVAGFATTKLGAWLDRSADHETKDAADLALILFWYAESQGVQSRLYDTAGGNDVLIAEEATCSALPRTCSARTWRNSSAPSGERSSSPDGPETRRSWPGACSFAAGRPGPPNSAGVRSFWTPSLAGSLDQLDPRALWQGTGALREGFDPALR